MGRAVFLGHAPARADALKQVEFAPAERDVVERFKRDIERHRARLNRIDAERKAQRELHSAA